MNIGLRNLNNYTGFSITRVPSMEQIYYQYIKCENFVASTEKMLNYGDQLFRTFDNLISLNKTAKRFSGSAEAMAVLNELVGKEFGGSFEAEDAKVATDGVWKRIQEFFKKIMNWFRQFFSRVLNFFGMAKSRLEAVREKLSKGAQIVDGGFDIVEPVDKEGIETAFKKFIINYKSFGPTADESNTNDFKENVNHGIINLQKTQSTHIPDATTASNYVNYYLKQLTNWQAVKRACETATNNTAESVKNAKGDGDIKKAKAAQEHLSLLVKYLHKAAAAQMRAISSLLAGCRFKGGAASKEKYIKLS